LGYNGIRSETLEKEKYVAGKAKTTPGLKLAGRRLWDHVLERFELEEYERLLLLEACRTVDIVNELQAAADALEPEGARLRGMRGSRSMSAAVRGGFVCWRGSSWSATVLFQRRGEAARRVRAC
jgi:hypothetical protein